MSKRLAVSGMCVILAACGVNWAQTTRSALFRIETSLPVVREVKDDHPVMPKELSPSATLLLMQGGWEGGYPHIWIDPQGKCQIIGYARETQVQLNPQAMEKIRAAFARSDFAHWPLAMQADVWDGTQQVVRVSDGDKVKTTYFDNCFPDEVTQLFREVDSIVSDPASGNVEWIKHVSSDPSLPSYVWLEIQANLGTDAANKEINRNFPLGAFMPASSATAPSALPTTVPSTPASKH